MADSYVCSKAKIKCSCGDKISTLTVSTNRTISLTGQPQANISDHTPMKNIAPFGRCHSLAYPATASATAAAHGKLTPRPCIPNTPFPWTGGKNDVLLKGQPALLKSSKCKCIWGGTITISFDGQSEGDKILVPTSKKEKFGIEIFSSTVQQASTWHPPIPKASQKVKIPYKKVQIKPHTAELVLKDFAKYSDNNRYGILLSANTLPDSINMADRLKLAEYNLTIAQSLKINIGAPMSIADADNQSSNPNYKPGNDYSINCATTSAAYILRLKGFNITAKSRSSNNELNIWLSKGLNSFKIWKNIDGSEAKPSTVRNWMKEHSTPQKPIAKMTSSLYKKFIEEKTAKEGVYIMTLQWKKGGGHATIIQRWRDNKGELHLSNIEPQVYNEKLGTYINVTNLINNMSDNPSDSVAIMRVDDKKFDTKYVGLFDKPDDNTKTSSPGSKKSN